jgi:hypothetical protein
MRFSCLVLLVVLCSCDKEVEGGIDSDPYEGEWRWIGSGGGWAGQTLPGVGDEPTVLALTGDGRVSLDQGERQIYGGRYRLYRGESIYDRSEPAVLIDCGLEGLTAASVYLQGVIRVNGDTLHIDSNLYDAGGSSFQRSGSQ